MISGVWTPGAEDTRTAAHSFQAMLGIPSTLELSQLRIAARDAEQIQNALRREVEFWKRRVAELERAHAPASLYHWLGVEAEERS